MRAEAAGSMRCVVLRYDVQHSRSSGILSLRTMSNEAR